VVLLGRSPASLADSAEELRLLSNFETATVKLLQIILAGQLRLRDMLAQAEMQQVQQRISLICPLAP
jgi:MSHA biogenesis protein MshM